MKLMKYYKEAREELSKVIFPTKEQIRNAFISVIIVVTVVTLFLGLADIVLRFGISNIVS